MTSEFHLGLGLGLLAGFMAFDTLHMDWWALGFGLAAIAVLWRGAWVNVILHR